MRAHRRSLLLLVTTLALCLATSSPAADPPKDPKGPATADKEAKAVEAARAWLALVDEGKYGESWEQAASFFKAAVPKAQWEQSLSGTRQPLGKRVSRELKTKQYATQLPGAPDGEYVVIEFSASFESKKESVERVTPTLEKDGSWRVSGYFIR